ncbi:MAG: hypothetical protein NTZ05_22705, partial [Chloroflexi bacterium]|nr:hypothetical protein [Chloroflexota bacterium]
GALDQAEERLRRAQEILEGPGPWGGLPGDVLAAEARVLGAQGQHEEAAAAFVRAVDFYGERGLVWDQARTYEAWGDALAEWRQSGAGDAMLPGDAAECRWRQAQELWGQMGAAPYADRCQEKLLEERGGSLSA